ncbi:hypothetical protein CEXT_653601 [Caerostris extrusa]|uniref:Uncharacterized protein n=1 Tax=Caerostris extrusa TaxID=172846 RepID=A0AAV4NAX7_CAEEX|nr:hypothetical protein CEXT_653601 [Caerostris extrusa]
MLLYDFIQSVGRNTNIDSRDAYSWLLLQSTKQVHGNMWIVLHNDVGIVFVLSIDIWIPGREASPLQHSCRTPSKELVNNSILLQNSSRTVAKDSNGLPLRSVSRSSCKEPSRTSSKESAVGGSPGSLPDSRTTPNQLHRPSSKDHGFSHSGDIQKCLRDQQQSHLAKSSPGLTSRISPSLFSESRTCWDQKDMEEVEDSHLYGLNVEHRLRLSEQEFFRWRSHHLPQEAAYQA